MALLVRAYRVGAIVVDRHIGGFGPAGRALHGAAACGGHQQGDQVLPVGHLQRLDYLLGVARLVVLQQRPLQRLALGGLFHKHRLQGVGVKAGVEHAGTHSAGGGVKILHLFRAHVVFVKIFCQIDCILEGATRVTGHQIGHQILLFAGLFAQLIEFILELVEGLDGRLAHIGQRVGGTVLRSHLQLAGHMVLYQFLEEGVVRVGHQVVEPDTAADEHLFHAR